MYRYGCFNVYKCIQYTNTFKFILGAHIKLINTIKLKNYT